MGGDVPAGTDKRTALQMKRTVLKFGSTSVANLERIALVADIVAARPVDLAIIDGIKTIAGGEGAWNRGVQPVSPGVIIAGTNCVSTDTVAMRVMGFDPMAKRGTPPFDVGGPGGGCDNSLELAEKLGVGSRDMNRIEIAGVPISEAVFNFSAHSRRSRRAVQRLPG